MIHYSAGIVVHSAIIYFHISALFCLKFHVRTHFSRNSASFTFVQRIYFTLLILNYCLHFNVWPTLILSAIYIDISNCWPSSGRLALRAFYLLIYTIIWDISTHYSLYVIYTAINCYLFPDGPLIIDLLLVTLSPTGPQDIFTWIGHCGPRGLHIITIYTVFVYLT